MAHLVTKDGTSSLYCVKKLQHDDKNSSSSQNKSYVRCSSSSRYEDKSEHYCMLLKEQEQCLSNRDVLIEMLQDQLRKMEDNYKKSLDDHQHIRHKYSSVVQELVGFKLICQKLEEENKKSSNICQGVTHLKEELEAAQKDAEHWRSDYGTLMQQYSELENNSKTTKCHNNLQPLLEQFQKIRDTLCEQNEKLNEFFQRLDHSDNPSHCSTFKHQLDVLKSSHDEIRDNLANIEKTKNFCSLEATESCLVCTNASRTRDLEETIDKQNDEIDALKLELETKCHQLCEVLAQNRDALTENSELLRKYEDSIDNLNQRYNSAMQELNNVKSSNQNLKDQFEHLQETVDHHKKEAEYSKNELDKSQSYVENLKSVIIKLENDQKQTDFELVQKSKDSEYTKRDLEARIENLQTLVKDINSENTNLLTQIEERDEQIKILLTEVHTLQAELEQVRDDIKHFTENSAHEVEHLMSVCKELDQQLKQTRQELANQAENCFPKEEYETLLEMNLTLKKEQENKEEETQLILLNLQNSLNARKTENNALVEHNNYLKTQLDVELSAHDKEMQKLKRTLTEQKKDNEELKKRLEQTNKEILDAENSKLKKINTLQTALQQEINNKNHIQQKLDIAHHELEILRQTGKSTSLLKIENTKLKDKVSNLENRLCCHHEQDTRITELQHVNEHLKSKIANLEKPIPKTATIEQSYKLAPIVEEHNSCNAQIYVKTISEDDKLEQDLDKYSITAQVTILYDNQQFQNGDESDATSNKSTDCRVCPKTRSSETSKVETLQLRLERINQMEKQVETMICAIKDQNKRMRFENAKSPKEKNPPNNEANKKKKDGFLYQNNQKSKVPVKKFVATAKRTKSSERPKSPKICPQKTAKCPHGHCLGPPS